MPWGESRPGDRAVLALAGTQAIVFSFTSFYLPVHLRENLHYTGAAIGVLFAVYSVTSILAAFPIGLGADRNAPRRLLYGGLGCLLVGALVVALFSDFGLVLLGFVALGLSLNIHRQVLDAVWYRHTDGDGAVGSRFGPYLGLRMFGMAVGMPLGGLVLFAIGFRPALLAVAGSTLLLALLVRGVPDVTITRTPIRNYVRDFARPRVLFFALWLFLFTLHWGAEMTHYALFLRENLGLNLSEMGLYMGGEFIALGSASWLVGRRWGAEAGSRGLLVVGLLLSGTAAIAMLQPPALLSFAFRFLHGAGDGIVMIGIYAAIGELFRLERIGGSAALAMLTTMLGGAAGSLLYGPLGDVGGHGLPLAISGMVCIALAPLILLVRRRRSSALT